MLGILAFGDNHLIVSGPKPDESVARALVRFWSVVTIGREVPEHLRQWTIVTKAFREELAWAWIVAAEGARSDAVTVLLKEMQDRGVSVDTAGC